MQGSGCRVQGSGFRVQGSGCRVQVCTGAPAGWQAGVVPRCPRETDMESPETYLRSIHNRGIDVLTMSNWTSKETSNVSTTSNSSYATSRTSLTRHTRALNTGTSRPRRTCDPSDPCQPYSIESATVKFKSCNRHDRDESVNDVKFNRVNDVQPSQRRQIQDMQRPARL